MLNQRKVTEYLKLKDAIAEMEKKADAIRAELLEVTSGVGGTTVVGVYTLSITKATRTNFDTKRAVLELGEVLTPYLSESEYSRLNVKRRA